MDVRLPDGTIVTNVPEGTTKSQLMARLGKAPGVVETADAPRLEPWPTQTPIPLAPQERQEGRIASIAQGMTLGTADELSGAAAAVGAGLQGKPMGQAYEQERDRMRSAAAKYAAEDPLSAAGSNIIGGLPYAVVGGGAAQQAATLPGRMVQGGATAGALGTVTGFASGEGGLQERGENAAKVGLASAAFGTAAPAVIEGAGALGKTAGRILVSGSGTTQAAKDARRAGYVIPPNMAQTNPSVASKAMSGWGGKIKTQQAASQKNQEITNALAAKELGINPKTQLSKAVFNDVRARAGQAYGGISQAMPRTSTDLTYEAGVQTLGNRMSEAAQEFPGLVKNKEVESLVSELSNKDSFSTKAAIQLVRSLRAKSSTNFKAFDNPERLALASSQREAANLLDDLIERRLAEIGKPNLSKQYKDARQLIAKSHDIEDATNLATGEVSARDIAKLVERGRPLTGGLETIAKAAGAFPKAFQDASTFGGTEGHSVLDVLGTVGSVAAGHPEIAGALVLRPAARGVVLSNPYQNMIVRGGGANVAPNTPRLPFDTRMLGAANANAFSGLLSNRGYEAP